ncbi:hypothetical protein RDWZM_003687 [Blomia tropicalis]|uniref:WH2 domain-containing protein n=1 Tax=Blomia tropicalis TaxID=40697 RepID=A0A9Q0MGA9_BLOTA|nr:hypothetical protein RDWZM_003687 [Blomia tropicalis]
MSAPPPPPPPSYGGPPPPPPPTFGTSSKGGGGGRAALLADIRGGARLKKAVTNDRSGPLLNNKPSAATAPSNGTNSGSRSGSSGSVASTPLNLGGLFANGIPKLKATGSKLIPEKTISNSRDNTSPEKPFPVNATNRFPSKTVDSKNFSNKLSSLNAPTSSLTNSRKSSSPEIEQARKNLDGILSRNIPQDERTNSNISNSNNNSSNLHRSYNNLSTNKKTTSNTTNTNKPVPPQKYHTISSKKHQYGSNQNTDMPAHKGQAPQPPSGGGNRSMLHRSNSQTNSRSNMTQNRPSPKPPNVKPPPPPPKAPNLENNGPARTTSHAPPPPPSAVTASNSVKNISAMMINSNLNLKPLNGGGSGGSGNNNSISNNKSSLHGSMQTSSGQSQVVKPPAPPRNSSYPNSLSSASNVPEQSQRNQTVTTNSQSNVLRPTHHLGHSNHSTSTTSLSSTSSQIHKSIRPPPGPPPPPPNRVSSVANSGTTIHRSQKPAPPIPLHIAPDGNMVILSSNSIENNPPPPPPVRQASMTKEPFASRFKFRDICELPAPGRLQNTTKVYPSQITRNRRREPPPPPPGQLTMINNTSANGTFANYPDKRYHIQINRGVAN